MANEKSIYGKKDQSHHDGKAAHRRRLLSAFDELRLGEQIRWSMAIVGQKDRLPPDLVEWHEDNLRFWGLLGQSINSKK